MAFITAACLIPAQAQDNHEDLTWFRAAAQGEKRAIQSKADWQLRRQEVLISMQEVMGPLTQPTEAVPNKMSIITEHTQENLKLQKITYHTQSPDHTISAWLIIPTAGQGRLPAMLCLHQTTVVGKDEPAGLAGNPKLSYALELSRRGYVTLSPDYPGLGERKADLAPAPYLSTTMRVIHENFESVGILATHPAVNKDRIGVIGHSLGGHNSIFTAVFDPRLKVIVSSCGFGTFRSYMGGNLKGWSSQYYMPRIATHYGNDPARMPFDFTELVACLAPRPFFANAPLQDNNFVAASVAQIFTAAAPIYALHEAQDALQLRQPNTGHEFPRPTREEAYAFIDKYLKAP